MARPKKGPPPTAAPVFAPEALDALIGERQTAAELEVLFRQMKKQIVERMLGAELTQHLGYAPGRRNRRGKPITATGRRRRRS